MVQSKKNHFYQKFLLSREGEGGKCLKMPKGKECYVDARLSTRLGEIYQTKRLWI